MRIIPARAGFTAVILCRASTVADHPRSRGVYSLYGQGLPMVKGIIPARAGFTWASTSPLAPQPDHPRSRGVYNTPPCWCPEPAGSSPLARGLLTRSRQQPRKGGIIPARAGFTCGARERRCHASDHPRSRGVYADSLERCDNSLGSSPLARGLRQSRYNNMRATGIIPARAGFTRAWPSLRRCSADHPRSRGVYREGARFRVPQAGSSPLARGLRDT